MLRADIGVAFGPTSFDFLLGYVDGGLTVAIWARALPELALRFGPRLWLGHGWIFDAEAKGATRQSGDVQFGVGLVVGADIMIAPGIELSIESEVGTHHEGVEYAVASGRTGFLGAYWGASVGLAFGL
jgi:hypothetical protein